MATRQVRTTNLVGLKSLSFIRPQTVSFSITSTKPSTRLYAFFDGVSVDAMITPVGGVLGDPVVTNAAGEISGTFALPAMTFNTGERVLRFQDSDAFEPSTVVGSTTGSASAKFTANGIEETYQTTINNITQIEVVINPIATQPQGDGGDGGDPLAQTFFTYGVTGGCFITKIDIFFQSKDPALPVWIEIRSVENGYPSSQIVSRHATCTLAPADVSISANASVPTTFTFSRPIYLEENRDYCFVLLANSNKYHVWTSKLGEVSVENGKTIFEQPFIGTLFKSENNITWTAEQTEDIKFTLYKAQFTSLTGSTVYKATAPTVLIEGSRLSVVSGSPVVTAAFQFQHGHKTGDFIVLSGNPGGNYRGIPNATISNPVGFAVTVIDDYTLTLSVGVNATSTGTLTASGILDVVFVDATGSGYVAPAITFSGGGGSGAAATATVVGGKITAVTVTNPGSGYTSSPTLSLVDASGSGAVLVANSEALFKIAVNRKYQEIKPWIVAGTPPETEISASTRVSSENYVVGTAISTPINETTNVGQLASVVSQTVETASFGASNSTEFTLSLSSTNNNVSPLVDIGEGPRLRMRNFLIGNSAASASELTPAAGTAQARYISQINTIETLSKDVRVYVEAASNDKTSFDVFIRTSVSGSTGAHTDGTWTKLVCATGTSNSADLNDYKDYLFTTSAFLNPFDAYDIKIVLYSSIKYLYPKIANYRAVILAT